MKISVLTRASILSIFRQRLNQIVETEPEAPTVVIEGDREDQRDDKQHHQNALVLSAYHQQHKEAVEEDYQLRYDHIRQDCTHEKAVFAFEERHAIGTVVPDMKRAFDY
jgi:hypothetical protein